MKIDDLKCLVMEHSSEQGNLGDSCAESGRYVHLKAWLGDPFSIDLNKFVTDIGFIRHPRCIWKEEDYSSDQALPLYLASQKSLQSIHILMKDRIKKARYRTGNGDLVEPGLFAALVNSKILINLFSIIQVLLFKFAYRWNDEKNKFEENEESSCDYLNWIHLALYAAPWVRRLVTKDILKSKVMAYYSVEPRCIFVIDLYTRAIDKFF